MVGHHWIVSEVSYLHRDNLAKDATAGLKLQEIFGYCSRISRIIFYNIPNLILTSKLNFLSIKLILFYSMSIPAFRSVNKLLPGSSDYGNFLKEYISSNPETRTDILTCTTEIDGLLFYSEDSVGILTFLQTTRSADGKRLTGVAGDPSDYYVFSSDISDVTSNFGS